MKLKWVISSSRPKGRPYKIHMFRRYAFNSGGVIAECGIQLERYKDAPIDGDLCISCIGIIEDDSWTQIK